MNLVSNEGALVDERNGVIVLASAAGAFRELGAAALLIEPADVPGTARAGAAALGPADRIRAPPAKGEATKGEGRDRLERGASKGVEDAGCA
jgi:hypothetical protein